LTRSPGLDTGERQTMTKLTDDCKASAKDWIPSPLISVPRFVPTVVPTLVLAIAVCVLAGCTTTAPPLTIPITAPPKWYAPLPPNASALSTTPEVSATSSLPHNGSLSSLSQWWQQQNDPLLVDLIEAAQLVSPTVITARSNIEQAQANRAVSEAALLPTLDAISNISRSLTTPINRTTVPPIVSVGQVGLQILSVSKLPRPCGTRLEFQLQQRLPTSTTAFVHAKSCYPLHVWMPAHAQRRPA
jgi:hypothetical protein